MPPEDSSPITGATRLGLLRTMSGSTCGSEAFFGGALDSPSQLPETLCNPSVRVLALIDAFPYELVGRNDTRHQGPLSSCHRLMPPLAVCRPAGRSRSRGPRPECRSRP